MSQLAQEQRRAQSVRRTCAWLPRWFPTERTHRRTPSLSEKGQSMSDDIAFAFSFTTQKS